jgi:hypothetical protein
MKAQTIRTVTDVGVAVNLAAGHVGEMSGRAMQEAGRAVGCPVAQTVGRAVEVAGRAWSDAAVSVGNRDAARMRGGDE